MTEAYPQPATARRAYTVVLNETSREGQRDSLAETLETAFAEAGIDARILLLHGPRFLALAEQAAHEAKRESRILVAAGGDGTVNAIATLCHRHDITLGIIPLGTFNYFARELGIPTDTQGAITTLLTGVPCTAAAGFAGERMFLNNASFGLYSTLIRKREEATSRFGRIRFIAALSAMLSVLRGSRSFSVQLDADGEERAHRTSLVFVGNNRLQLENLGLMAAEFAARDTLAVIVLKRTSRMENLRILLRSLMRTLKDEAKLEEFSAMRLCVRSRRPRIDLVIDGEIVRATAPLAFHIEANALQVIAPADAPLATEAA